MSSQARSESQAMKAETSRELEALIRRRLDEAGGWMPFDAFMAQALYEPGLGYYESARVFGAAGDFVTAPELGPWLSLAVADFIQWGWEALGRPADWSLIEQGGGSGRLLCDVMAELARRGLAPARVIAVEASRWMRERQREAYAATGLDVRQTASLDEIEPRDNALYFCNELPDAFPVRCFAWRGGAWRERGVVWRDEQDGRDGRFAWNERALDAPPAIDERLAAAWPDGYCSEWNPGLATWQQALARVMPRGYALCVDYGYAASEYYRPGRSEGTLLAHVGHQAVEDVLAEPGGRDITAHVDFTALTRAGRSAGIEPACWMPQGAWLAQSPAVQARVGELARAGGPEGMDDMAALRRLVMPQGMGELFKALIQARGAPAAPPPWLERFDRLPALEHMP